MSHPGQRIPLLNPKPSPKGYISSMLVADYAIRKEVCMPVQAGFSIPTLHVADVERSIRFYQLLGFATSDTDGSEPLGWARMQCDGGAIAFLRTVYALDRRFGSFQLCLYTADLVAMREELLAEDIAVGPIHHPGYAPGGKVSFHDPDGYIVEIAQWGAAEAQHWLGGDRVVQSKRQAAVRL